MKRRLLGALLCLVSLASLAKDLAADPATGALKADSERCVECHGLEGQGDGHGPASPVRFAKLAGQQADYLLQQLLAFRSGQRRSDVMQLNVRHLHDDDLRELAAWYASRTPMQAAGPRTVAPALYARGDAERGIAPCASCHDTAAAPRLAGQEERYLARQLDDFRSGWRAAGSAMNVIARRLTDAEIRELAGYLAKGAVP